MPEDLKRVSCTTVTEALIAATEEAEDMGHVLIIYERANGDPGGIVCDNSLTVRDANWLLDLAKRYIWRD